MPDRGACQSPGGVPSQGGKGWGRDASRQLLTRVLTDRKGMKATGVEYYDKAGERQ